MYVRPTALMVSMWGHVVSSIFLLIALLFSRFVNCYIHI